MATIDNLREENARLHKIALENTLTFPELRPVFDTLVAENAALKKERDEAVYHMNYFKGNNLQYAKELADLEARLKTYSKALYDIRDNFDHELDAHKYKTTCRVCLADAALRSKGEEQE